MPTQLAVRGILFYSILLIPLKPTYTDVMPQDAIWIIDDDADDRELVETVLQESNSSYTLEFFSNGPDALKRLETAKHAPFIILCDVNLPGMSGFELRKEFLAMPNKKFHSVPFIFWSNAASERQIDEAYKLRGHGFFVKEARFADWRKSLMNIITYWSNSKVPSKKDAPHEPLI
jgi:CheY-like chemotaxis protein